MSFGITLRPLRAVGDIHGRRAFRTRHSRCTECDMSWSKAAGVAKPKRPTFRFTMRALCEMLRHYPPRLCCTNLRWRTNSLSKRRLRAQHHTNGLLAAASTKKCYGSHQESRPFLLKLITQHMTDLDSSLVIDWNNRSRRTRKPPPKTYWDEYVATDAWYVRELIADVPADEFHAAVECEDWSAGAEGEDGDESEEEEDGEESDSDYSEEEGGDGTDVEDEGWESTSASDVDSADTTLGHSPRSPSRSPPTTPEPITPEPKRSKKA